jgi:parallel beta-helix repeat protein
VLATALVLSVSVPAPAAAQTAEPIAGVWTVPPGDADQIQPAVNAARDAGGGAVYLPSGLYLLTAKVRVHSNVTLFGDGIDRTVLRWAPDAKIDTMVANGSQTDGNTNIQIRDLTLDGQRLPSGRKDCCFGLRLNNVHDSYVVNVAATGHSIDGIYLGHAGDGGAVNVRVSGCVASGNFRNGISVVEGDGVTIDHCRVEKNNLTEKIAGIDLEPDEGETVTNVKLIANTVTGQDVGLRLYVPYSGFARVSNIAVCQNDLTGNRGLGIYERNTEHAVYVDNTLSSNRKNPPNSPRSADACGLPALPLVPAVPAPGPADGASG